MKSKMEQILLEGFAAYGIEPDAGAVLRYERFYEYLSEQNGVMNLTAITGREDTARLHYLDCVALLTAAQFTGKKVIDVGTGAGFPAMPLKIARPELDITMLDSQKKRIDFLSEACRLLGLGGVRCIHGRAEEAARQLREQFDISVSRAVARLNVLCELCMPFVRPGGLFIAMKGFDCDEELAEAQNAIDVLGGAADEPFIYTIPQTDIVRKAVIIRKIAPTPKQYPRRFSKLQKSPL